MKKIVPFKKEIIFKDNLAEITSISLEHNFQLKEHSVTGEFIVSGEYKITSTSTNTESFSYNLPFEVSLDERYGLENANVDVDDFYYEIINDKVLSVNIEILIDQLVEKEVVTLEELNRNEKLNQDEIEFTKEVEPSEPEKRCIEEEDVPAMGDIFNQIEESRNDYKSYSIYIVREGDSIETIMEKYNITKEELEDYNDLKELKIGDKIIIPCNVWDQFFN